MFIIIIMFSYIVEKYTLATMRKERNVVVVAVVLMFIFI